MINPELKTKTSIEYLFGYNDGVMAVYKKMTLLSRELDAFQRGLLDMADEATERGTELMEEMEKDLEPK